MIEIRPEKKGDIPAVRVVNERAFEQPIEADIVDRLRQDCESFLSFVAVDKKNVVGHIFFSPVTVEIESGKVSGMGLAPMAVLPECQRQRIGSALVEHGLAALRQQKCPFVVVLGHPEYYPRFGFRPASQYGLKSQWPGVPDEAFMVIVFDQAVMKDIKGIARYREEFDAAV